MDVYLPFALLNTYVFISTRTINKIFSFHLGESQTYLIPLIYIHLNTLLFTEHQQIQDYMDKEALTRTCGSPRKREMFICSSTL